VSGHALLELINDIYTCDEYFGESSLHMAIVNEDVRILKLLLDHGANVHERCLGSFFLPNDQKDKANGQIRHRLLLALGLDLQSNQFSDPQTNYEGYTYWGEFISCVYGPSLSPSHPWQPTAAQT
jgi:ankyrin repeat protein